MQLGRKIAEGYAADPEVEEIAPPVVENTAAEPRVEVETATEPVRA
jgi:hypothetical protein